MSLENIYYIGQTIAVLAIIGSLIVLIFQVRQANALTREAAVREQIDGLKQIFVAIYENADITDIYIRGMRDYSQLSEVEFARFRALSLSLLRQWEGLHIQFCKGWIDKDIWSAHTRQLRSSQKTGTFKHLWSTDKELFDEDFQGFIEAQLVISEAERAPDLADTQE